MQGKQPTFGKSSRLDSAVTDLSLTDTFMPLYDSRPVLWRNIAELMHQKYGKEHLSQLAKEAKIGLATISRIKNQDTSIGLEVIDRIAAVFGVEPWQLMHPDFLTRPTNASSYSPLAADLAQQLDEIGEQATRERAHALATQVLGLAASSTSTKHAPGEKPTEPHASDR